MYHWIFDLDDTLYRFDGEYAKYLSKKNQKKQKNRNNKQNNDKQDSDGKNINKNQNNSLYIDYSFFSEDKTLKILLTYLTGNRIVMTNSVSHHCRTVLQKIGIIGHFDKIFDRESMNSMKPHPITYLLVNNHLQIKQGDVVVFFDDMPLNLLMAKKFGWVTVLITPQPYLYRQSHPSIDFVFPSVHRAIAFFLQKMYNIQK